MQPQEDTVAQDAGQGLGTREGGVQLSHCQECMRPGGCLLLPEEPLSVNIVCRDGMRAFLHFVCASLFLCIVQKVGRWRVPHFCVILRLRIFQCVDFVLITLLKGGLNFSAFSFRVVTDALTLV